MNRLNNHGFTIVELLIVIVVIGILAAITIVSYNAVQQRASNQQTAAGVTQYAKGLLLHHAEFGALPGPVYDESEGVRYVVCMDGTTDCWGGVSAERSVIVSGALSKIMGGLPEMPHGHAFTYTSQDGYYILYTQKGTSECPEISGTTPGTKTISGNNVQCRAKLILT